MASVSIVKLGAWLGGTVADIAACGNVTLAATFAGLFRSEDGGRGWQPVGQNLPDWFIQTVALAPAGDRIVGLAASHTGWLYYSTDGGQTWETHSHWPGQSVITRLAASPDFETDGMVFACTEENGIFKSSDRGRNWKQASLGLLNLSATSLCFSPGFAEDEVVFAGTDGGGLFRSRNAGRAWRESGEGLPDSTVQCLGASPGFAVDGTIWAGTEDRGIYRSTDGGRTWSPLGEALSQACINSLYLSPQWKSGGNIVAATHQGLLVSADAGKSWQSSQDGADYPYVVVPCRDHLLAGAHADGIYRSATGVSWQRSNDGLAAHVPPLVHFSADFERDQAVLMASMEGVLARSMDGGQTWRILQEQDEFPLAALAGAGKGESITLFSAAGARLARSQDSGETWAGVLDTTDDTISAVALSPTYDQDQAVVVGTSEGQVLLSCDGGVTWEQAASFQGEPAVALAIRTVRGEVMAYAVTARPTANAGWQLTLRGGASWQTLSTLKTGDPVSHLYLHREDAILCAMGTQVLYLEGDNPIATFDLGGEALVSCLAVAGNALLAGTRQGLHRSTDGAQTWHSLTTEVGALALQVASADQLYAVSMGGQLWRLDLSPRPG